MVGDTCILLSDTDNKKIKDISEIDTVITVDQTTEDLDYLSSNIYNITSYIPNKLYELEVFEKGAHGKYNLKVTEKQCFLVSTKNGNIWKNINDIKKYDTVINMDRNFVYYTTTVQSIVEIFDSNETVYCFNTFCDNNSFIANSFVVKCLD